MCLLYEQRAMSYKNKVFHWFQKLPKLQEMLLINSQLLDSLFPRSVLSSHMTLPH